MSKTSLMRLKRDSKISVLKEHLLIRRAKKGDSEAFGELYLAYLDQIYRYIYFRVNQDRQVAEDIAQDVFLKAFERIISYKKKKSGGFRAWLYQIARNKTIDHLRTNGESVKFKGEIIDLKEDIENGLIIKEEYKALLSAIRKLPKLQKEIITLAYINDLSNKDIAKITGKNDEAVRAVKYRALKNLKRLKKNEN